MKKYKNDMCLYPKLIRNKRYTPNKKNKGMIPECKDDRTIYVPIGCGKCVECMKQKKRNWQVRLLEEIKVDRQAIFVTLTFTNEAVEELKELILVKNLIWENEVATLAVRRFLERIRKKYKKSCKHLLITELGHEGSERIHLHGIMWNTYGVEELTELWKYGNVWIGDYVNEKTINYIVKYINKLDEQHKGYIPKILCSAGIGSSYIKRWDSKHNAFNGKNTKEFYKTSDGSKLSLPTYWRNKIYTEEERGELWINKLDEGIRYVMGEKVNVKCNEDEYFAVLEEAREKNKRLGYGDDTKEWKKESYIKQLNELKYKTNYQKNLKDEIERRSKTKRCKT